MKCNVDLVICSQECKSSFVTPIWNSEGMFIEGLIGFAVVMYTPSIVEAPDLRRLTQTNKVQVNIEIDSKSVINVVHSLDEDLIEFELIIMDC